MNRFCGVQCTEQNICPTSFPISFQRITRHAGSQENEIIEVRQSPFRTPTSNIVKTGFRSTLDFVNYMTSEDCRFPHSGKYYSGHNNWGGIAYSRSGQYKAALSI